jgi:hypothetical protein
VEQDRLADDHVGVVALKADLSNVKLGLGCIGGQLKEARLRSAR